MPPRVPCRSGMSIYGSRHSQAENSSYLTNRSASHAPLAETPRILVSAVTKPKDAIAAPKPTSFLMPIISFSGALVIAPVAALAPRPPVPRAMLEVIAAIGIGPAGLT